MTILRLIVFIVLVGSIPETPSSAASNPPPGCLNDTTGFREVRASPHLAVWLNHNTGGWHGCLQLGSCYWSTQDAEDTLALLQPLMSTGAVSACTGYFDGTEFRYDCDNNEVGLENVFGLGSQVFRDVAPGDGTVCPAAAPRVLTSGFHRSPVRTPTYGEVSLSVVELRLDRFCLSILSEKDRRFEIAVLASRCTGALSDISRLADQYSPILSKGGRWLGLAARDAAMAIRVGPGSNELLLEPDRMVWGDLNSAAQVWLEAVSLASTSSEPLEASDDPLPSVVDNNPASRLLHWYAAAIARLEPIPFGIGWDEPNSISARNWMAAHAVRQEPVFKGTLLRAELVRQ